MRGMAGTPVRTRTFEGCDTCRLRHVRCGTERPSCKRCTKLGLLCGGYEKNAVFESSSSPDRRTAPFRRPISTELERQRMSDNLTNKVGLNLAVRYIRQIDKHCDVAPLATDLNIIRGPFTAFHLNQPSTGPAPPDPEQDSTSLEWQIEDLQPSRNIPTLISSGHPSPTTEALIAAISGDCDQFDFLFPDFGSRSQSPRRIEELFDLDTMPGQTGFVMSPTLDLHSQMFSDNTSPSPFITTCEPRSQVPCGISADAVQLLTHFTTTVLGLLTPFRHTKTPWHILFIPHIKSCLAAVALNEQLDHASLCIFHGTLTLSALSLNGLSPGDVWAQRADLHEKQALQHARVMLRTAYDTPKTAKYKTILMALITMIQLSLFTSMTPDPYFLEAEKFIRLKGLDRRKSRKVRLLHHCYVFERMLHESTAVNAVDSAQKTAMIRAVASSGVVVHGQDSPDFRIPNLSDLERSLQRVKSQEEGENDLLLAHVGDFPATMYPEVFAIPETYMMLLSLIVRLVKAKDAMKDLPQDFLSQAKSLERAILGLKWNHGSSLKSQRDENILCDMRHAMHEALLLYFYRRIYDIDASLLQNRARLVCECLLRCEAADSQSLYGSSGFRWPAFIAACETEELDVQESFTLLFRRLAHRSGLSMFTNTLNDIQQVWQEKQQGQAFAISWVDVMKRRAG